MPQSLVQIYAHVIFSTKNREPFLQDPAFRERVHSYLIGICKGQDCPSLQVGGVADHVHILCRLSKTLEIASLIRELKRASSKWIKENNADLRHFYWQSGYGVFSVSPSHLPGLTEYIQHQEQHHQQETYQDEVRRLCKKYGVALDERYAWD
jgi:REP element-mobilizing transposase RayT